MWLLAGRAVNGSTSNMGVELEVLQQQKLLRFLTDQGFSGCSEPLLRRLHKHMGWTTPQPSQKFDAEHHWAISCMLNFDNTLILDEVVDSVVRRHQAERTVPDADDDELEAIIRDTMLVGDQDDALKELSKRRTPVTAKAVRGNVEDMYKNVARGIPAARWKKGEPSRKNKEKLAEQNRKAAVKAYDRKYDVLAENVDDRLRALLPATSSSIRVFTDHKNGRWRLSFNNDVVHVGRSISWTMVGQEQAAVEAVRQCWSWHETFQGAAPPVNLDERLRKAFSS